MPKGSPKTSEKLTRKQIIDGRLRDAGWRIVPESEFDPSKSLKAYHGCAIEEYPTENGPADYALCVGGRILGIVEAKKLTLGTQNVLSQAERYSRGVAPSPYNFGGLQVPFLYSTNGEVIWHHDIRHELNRSHQISHFHAPTALAEFAERDLDDAIGRLQAMPNNHPLLRPYQKNAKEETEKAIAKRKRQMLIAMATGTGKTFTMVNQVYRLMESGVAKCILFLVVSARACRPGGPGIRFIPARGLRREREVRSQSPAQILSHGTLRQARLRVRIDDTADDDQSLRPQLGVRSRGRTNR